MIKENSDQFNQKRTKLFHDKDLLQAKLEKNDKLR